MPSVYEQIKADVCTWFIFIISASSSFSYHQWLKWGRHRGTELLTSLVSPYIKAHIHMKPCSLLYKSIEKYTRMQHFDGQNFKKYTPMGHSPRGVRLRDRPSPTEPPPTLTGHFKQCLLSRPNISSIVHGERSEETKSKTIIFTGMHTVDSE